MKRVCHLIAVSAAIAFMFSCTVIEKEELLEEVEVTRVEFVIPPFDQQEDGATKAVFNPDDGYLYWEAGDRIGIVPSEGCQLYFEVNTGGSKTASFNGGAWGLKSGPTYWSYYPFVPDFDLDKTAVPIDLYDQVQSGNGSAGHIGGHIAYYTGGTSASGGVLSFQYHHLACIFKTYVEVPAGTYDRIVYRAGSRVFLNHGTFDITSSSPAIEAVSDEDYVNEISLSLEDCTVSDGEELVTYLLVAPGHFANVPIMVEVYQDGIAKYHYSVTKTSSSAGKVYAFRSSAPQEYVESAEEANQAFAAGATEVAFSEVPTEDVSLLLPDTTEDVTISFPSGSSDAGITLSYPQGAASCPANLTITAPDGASLELATPGTTVTIKGSSYSTVVSSTADHTLIISEDVNVELLKVLHGSVEVYGTVDRMDLSDQDDDAKIYVYGHVDGMTEDTYDNASDLSDGGTANCYIVSSPGLYKFRTVRGNTEQSVGVPARAEILWESFGTNVAPEAEDIVRNAYCSEDYVVFNTPSVLRNGNAVIAVRDAFGSILWSWHIWVCKNYDPAATAQVYNNNAGILMDRNLGAISATPGDVGALGLMYQWGRKDPFLGSSSIPIGSTELAASSLSWPAAENASDHLDGNNTLAYSVSHPTTFLGNGSDPYDWYCASRSDKNDDLWSDVKTVYDPCPKGWHVPEGGVDGVWGTAMACSNYGSGPYDSENVGMNFGSGNGKSSKMQLGSSTVIWYPLVGWRSGSNGSLVSVGKYGMYWSHNPYDYSMQIFRIDYRANVNASLVVDRASGNPVRCISESSAPIIPVTGVTISQTELSIKQGTTFQLTASVVPSNANVTTITWSSSNVSVATVDASGLVTGVSNGSCEIFAKAYNGCAASCALRVRDVTPGSGENEDVGYEDW